MPTFAYTARDKSGSSSSGTIEAPTRRDAIRRLQMRGLQPIRLDEPTGAKPARAKKFTPSSTKQEPAITSASAAKAAAARSAPTAKERLPFLEALADLVRGGLSAGEAIRLLSVRVSQPRLRTLCAAIWSSLSEGQTLSAALAQFPDVFDGQTVNLIAAGEATGNLRDVLERLIAHFIEQKELRAKLAGAMAYPIFVCLLAFGVILFFLFFLMPKLKGLLGALGGELPWATKLLVNTSETALRYGPFVIIAGVIALIAFWQWRRTPSGRMATDELALRIPILRGFAVRGTVLNFAHTLAVLLENGITTAEALRLAERTVGNEALRARFNEATTRVLEGESLSVALGRTEIFEPILLDRLSVSEQTGNLAPGLRDIARTCRSTLDKFLNTFTKSISAGVLVVAFTFVGFIAYAIVSAVFEVSSSLRF